MPEMAHARKDHGEIEPVRRCDHFGVFDRSAGLYESRRAKLRGFFNTIGEREESVGRDHRTRRVAGCAFMAPILTESTRLICPAPTADNLPGASVNDGIRLTCLTTFQPNPSAIPFFGRRLPARLDLAPTDRMWRGPPSARDSRRRYFDDQRIAAAVPRASDADSSSP